MQKSEHLESEAISIKFYGVSNLKIDEIGGGISQFVRLDLVSIKNKQWENLNYQVFDYENENISLLCRDFEVNK